MKKKLLFLLLSVYTQLNAQPNRPDLSGFENTSEGWVYTKTFKVQDKADIKSALLEKLASNTYVILSNYQPADKIICKVQGMPGNFDKVLMWVYDFGFAVTFTDTSYVLNGRNFIGTATNGIMGNSKMSLEEWMKSQGVRRKEKWTAANSPGIISIFMLNN